jgi:hypothetical protein
MKRLSISKSHAEVRPSEFWLPSKICTLVSMVSSLECLTLTVQDPCNSRILAESIRSLQRLKVHWVACSAALVLFCTFDCMCSCTLPRNCEKCRR